MRLILSSSDPRDSLYSTEAGKVLYKVDKSKSSTSLRKAVNNGQFALYAQVEFHTFKKTRFRFNNADVSVDKFFRKKGWFNPKSLFRATDGSEYYWKLDGRHLKMFRNDGSKQELVKFLSRRRSFGGFVAGRPASLEVDDNCGQILDEIIMTFVYSHKQRQDNTRQEISKAGVDVGAAIASV